MRQPECFAAGQLRNACEKWSAAATSQPTLPKSDRLPGDRQAGVPVGSGFEGQGRPSKGGHL